MLSHVHIGVTDFDRALRFYEAVMAALGTKQRFIERDRPWAGWQPADAARPLLLIGLPFDGNPASAGNGQMIALLAPSRAAVTAAYGAALAHGGTRLPPPHLRRPADAAPLPPRRPGDEFADLDARHALGRSPIASYVLRLCTSDAPGASSREKE